MPEVSRALTGNGTWLRPARSAVVILIDGLGMAQLRARVGHARFLSAAAGPHERARTAFPSTTATALTGLLTGAPAGRHGIVGYRVKVPGTRVLANQLRGWEDGALDSDWHRLPALTSTMGTAGVRAVVVSKPEYARTGFTRATTTGAEFVGVSGVEERVARAMEEARTPGTFVYLYVPELDSLGHRFGWESDRWTAMLERVDGALRGSVPDHAAQIGVIVTADHGMIDVPPAGHVLLTEGDGLLEDVVEVAGEPRMLHLYTAPARAAAVANAWRESEESRSWVFTRAEAIEEGLFGDVDPVVQDRIGDVLVAARSRVAYYDDRLTDKAAQRMVGQHGSLTLEETLVPLLRLGAFAP
ncbi:alkaline phosphatase family protein [Microbacterium sediminicola]|uniref:Alkaline phosphatase family protein n=1 Tax=Microbacterium sediminicola TaxID=415210 RepID=A0ABP4TT15_9MICO